MDKTKTCARCRKTKSLSEFRFMQRKRAYCSYCRQCENEYTKERREALKVVNLKLAVKRNFLRLVPSMDQCECDKLLYELKRIYEVNKHDD